MRKIPYLVTMLMKQMMVKMERTNKGKYCVISAIIRVRILTDIFLWMSLNCLKAAEQMLEDSLVFPLSLKGFLVLI